MGLVIGGGIVVANPSNVPPKIARLRNQGKSVIGHRLDHGG